LGDSATAPVSNSGSPFFERTTYAQGLLERAMRGSMRWSPFQSARTISLVRIHGQRNALPWWWRQAGYRTLKFAISFAGDLQADDTS
jgi:hypothetical protein